METATETRTCRGPCGRILPASREYFYYNPRSNTRLRHKCIYCFNEDIKDRHRAKSKEYSEYQKAWRKSNPLAVREHRLKYRYGISLDDYDQMLSEQGGGCAICGSDHSKSHLKYLYVDHCHDTGKVRGLLCYHCNTTLGYMNDDPETLRSAISYLEQNYGA